jgi:hypothetical protein
LNTDGSTTESGSSHAEENYTFDQVSESSAKSSEERTEEYSMSAEIEDPSTRYTMWDKQEYEYREKTTDHYEAALSSDASAGSASSLPTGSDAGYTDAEWFNKSCHSWDDNGTPGGPDCNESTTTDHEDWPSLVDAALAMMQDEAEAVGDADDADGEGSGAPPCATCSETDEGGADTSHENGSPTSDDPGTALSSLPWWISTLNGQIVRVTIDGITFTGENAAFDAAVHATTTGNPAAAEEIGNALRVLRVRADIAARVRAADLARLRNLRATQVRAAAGLGAEGTVSLGMVGMTIGLIGRVLDSARTIAGIGQRRQQLIDDAIVLPPVYSEDSVDPGLPVIIGK